MAKAKATVKPKVIIPKEIVNLYEVSLGVYQYFTVAKTELEAIAKVSKENHLEHLPLKAILIDTEGYKLVRK